MSLLFSLVNLNVALLPLCAWKINRFSLRHESSGSWLKVRVRVVRFSLHCSCTQG